MRSNFYFSFLILKMMKRVKSFSSKIFIFYIYNKEMIAGNSFNTRVQKSKVCLYSKYIFLFSTEKMKGYNFNVYVFFSSPFALFFLLFYCRLWRRKERFTHPTTKFFFHFFSFSNHKFLCYCLLHPEWNVSFFFFLFTYDELFSVFIISSWLLMEVEFEFETQKKKYKENQKLFHIFSHSIMNPSTSFSDPSLHHWRMKSKIPQVVRWKFSFFSLCLVYNTTHILNYLKKKIESSLRVHRWRSRETRWNERRKMS